MKLFEMNPKLILISLIFSSSFSSCGKKTGGEAAPIPSPSPTTSASPTPTPTPSPLPSPSLGPDIPVVVEPNLESIQNNYVNVNCVSCHTSATTSNRHVDLTNISKLIVDKPGTNRIIGPREDLIVRGCPNLSFFFTITKSGEMPPGARPHAKPEELTAMNDWITSLKANADCSTGEPEDDRGPGEP